MLCCFVKLQALNSEADANFMFIFYEIFFCCVTSDSVIPVLWKKLLQIVKIYYLIPDY